MAQLSLVVDGANLAKTQPAKPVAKRTKVQ